jgi:hypothetical protein
MGKKQLLNSQSTSSSDIKSKVLVLLIQTFSVYLSLLIVAMLGCVAMDFAPPYQTALRGIISGYLSPGFPSWVGLSGADCFFEMS